MANLVNLEDVEFAFQLFDGGWPQRWIAEWTEEGFKSTDLIDEALKEKSLVLASQQLQRYTRRHGTTASTISIKAVVKVSRPHYQVVNL